MANVKISQLPSATTPLGGSEEIPLVQGTTTKKVTVGGLFTSPVLTTPNLGTPSAVNLTNATNVPVNQATGVLPVANGGTNATTASTARTNLGAAASGANSDITSMSGITGGVGTADYVAFDTSYATTLAAGQLGWDGNNTLGIGMAGGNVVQKIGEDSFYYVKASSAITKGQVVMFTGAVGASGVVTGAPATGVSDGSYIMGVAAESIALNGFGLVQFQGTLRGLNTSAYADGDILWYDPAVTGGLTKTKPSAPNIKVQMAAVVNAGSGSSGSILVRVSAGSVLGGTDSNVQFGTLANNNLIQYDSANQYWKNVSSISGSQVSGNISGNAANVTGTVAIANGGTGQTTANAAFNALAPSQTGNAGKVLSTDGTNTSWSTASVGTVTSVAVSGGTTGLTTSGGPVTSSGTITLAGTLAVANGGTGQTSYTDGQLLIGNSATGGLTKATLVQGTNVSIVNGNGTITISATGGSGGGNVTGPASSTNNAVVLFDGTTGQLIKDSAQTIATANTASTVVARDASGNFSAGTITATGLSDSGNLTFTGTGNRITGDFSNATIANRVMFQTSTANGQTIPVALPNGTSGVAGFAANSSSSDPANASEMTVAVVGGSDVRFSSNIRGTGTYLPMTFYTSGSEKLRIAADTTGTYTFGGTAPRITGDFSNATLASRVAFQTSTVNGNTTVNAIPNGTATTSQFVAHAGTDMDNTSRAGFNTSNTQAIFFADKSGTGTFLPMNFYTGGSERVRIDTSGNVGIGTSSPSSKLDVLVGDNTIAQKLRGATAIVRIYPYYNFGGYNRGGMIEAVNAAETAYSDLSLSGNAIQFLAGASLERMRIDSSGNVLVTGGGGLGYGTGSGGTVTQATSRTTGVTLNKPTGAITLVSAAGTATYQTFTVTNSSVAATDTISVSQKSGTDKYIILVTAVGAGSFAITFATTGGTTTEQPVFNFNVIKGATS